MNNQNDTFQYTYSASKQKEVEAIRNQYISSTTPAQIDQLEKLKRLDAGVKNKTSMIAISLGLLGTLIMGFGMSLIMTDLGTALGINTPIFPGMIFGLLGMILVITAYPLYQIILKKERKKIAPQVLQLTEQLLNH